MKPWWETVRNLNAPKRFSRTEKSLPQRVRESEQGLSWRDVGPTSNPLDDDDNLSTYDNADENDDTVLSKIDP